MDCDHLARADGLSRALSLMRGALVILDEHGAPGEIGAHLDHAIVRLEAELGIEGHAAQKAEALIASF